MQFPRPCVELHIRIVGLATFVDAVESSLNRIACETAPRMCARNAHVGPLRCRLTAGRLTLVHPRARGPVNVSVGSPAQTRNSGFTSDIAGWRTRERVRAHISGVNVRATHQARRWYVHNADGLRRNAPLLAFVAEVVCDLVATPPRTVTSPPPNGGNCSIRSATRRRHADRMLLMVQNPHPALGELRPGVACITDHLAHQAHVSHFSSRWDALWALHPRRPPPYRWNGPPHPCHRPSRGGTCSIRGARSSSAHVEGAIKRGELQH